MKSTQRLIVIIVILFSCLSFKDHASWSILHNEAIESEQQQRPSSSSSSPQTVFPNTTIEQTDIKAAAKSPFDHDYDDLEHSNHVNTINTSSSKQSPPAVDENVITTTTSTDDSAAAKIAESTTATSPSGESNNETTSTSTAATPSSSSFVLVDVVVNNKDMQSFEEWKEMKLKSAASQVHEQKQAQKKEGGATGTSPASSVSAGSDAAEASPGGAQQNPSAASKLQQQQQQRKNYASLDCGAKVIAHNSEAKNAAHVLTESKDDYMLNACASPRIWFAVELCEPIKISEFELANMELFSNVPRQFRIYASERYPGKTDKTPAAVQAPAEANKDAGAAGEAGSVPVTPTPATSDNWYLLGTYEAANTRTVQTFSILSKQAAMNSSSPLVATANNSNATTIMTTTTPSIPSVIMYAKYVKFEMLSHYGSEHYCPLTLVRVYGTSIVDEEDALHQNDEFTAAILQQQQQEIAAATTTTTTQATSTTTTSSSILTDMVNKAINTIVGGETTTIPPAKSSQSRESFDSTSSFLHNVISVVMKESSLLKSLLFGKTATEEAVTETTTTVSSFNTEYDAHVYANRNAIQENAKAGKGTLALETATSLEEEVRRTKLLHVDLYRRLCMTSHVTNACCQCRVSGQHSVDEDEAFNWLPKHCGYYFLLTSVAGASDENSLLVRYGRNMRLLQPNLTVHQEAPAFTRININNVNYYILNEFLMTDEIFQEQRQQQPEPVVMATTTTTSPPMIVKPPVTPTVSTTATAVAEPEDSTVDNKAATTTTTTTSTTSTESVENSEKPEEQAPVVVDSTTSTSSKSPLIDSITATVAANLAEAAANETTTQSTATTPSPPTNTFTLPSSPPIIANGKDALFMRLNNRIKLLELNMTLSSQYLEQLSQHYRKQMDEMQRAFNKTTGALLNASRLADERDAKQQERIVALEKKLEKQQLSIEALSDYVNELQFRVIFLVWTSSVLFSVCVFVALFYCVRSTRMQARTRLQQTAELDALIQKRLDEFFATKVQQQPPNNNNSVSMDGDCHVETFGILVAADDTTTLLESPPPIIIIKNKDLSPANSQSSLLSSSSSELVERETATPPKEDVLLLNGHGNNSDQASNSSQEVDDEQVVVDEEDAYARRSTLRGVDGGGGGGGDANCHHESSSPMPLVSIHQEQQQQQLLPKHHKNIS